MRNDTSIPDAEPCQLDITLDRFASGRMLPEEERRFLARCESEPELWRSATLVLVEERTLAAALVGADVVERAGTAARKAESARSPGIWTAVAVSVVMIVGALTAWLPSGERPNVPATATPRPGSSPAGLLPATVHEILRDAGIEVREEPVLRVVDGDDGERWAVPETRVHVRFVKQGGS